MTAGERGFLLLTGYLGDPERKPLSVAQFRELTRRARLMEQPLEDRQLTQKDLLQLGCDRSFAHRILQLLSQQDQLDWYLDRSRQKGCVPISRLSEQYPRRLRNALGLDAPAVLWAKGDLSLLNCHTVSAVGSRDLRPENQQFAQLLGARCAAEGVTVVSGNARGSDKTVQESALAHGGTVICVVADALHSHKQKDRVLYLSEDGFDLGFSSLRALRRNRIIHSLSERTFIVQCTLGKGGTWDGTTKNLQYGWSTVCCFRDGSDACRELSHRGAVPVTMLELNKLLDQQIQQMKIFDQ